MDGVWNAAWGWVLLAGSLGLAAGTLGWRRHHAPVGAPAPAPEVDALTGLATRHGLEAGLEDALAHSDREQRPLAVMVIGLDNFRQVNDAYGRAAGDGLLAAVPQRLRDALPDALLLARSGGDEFGAVFWGARDEAHDAAARVLAELRRVHTIDGHEVRIEASAGLMAYRPGGEGRRLLTQAAAAMRFVKRNGGGAHAEFQPAMAVDLRRQAELLRDLRQAVETGALQLVYQPKFDARSLRTTGAEALLRWHDGRRGLVGPQVFVPLAEKHGLIDALGRWVVEQATRQCGEWHAQGLPLRLAVNLAPSQLHQPEALDHLCACLQRHGVPPAQLTCEVSEPTAMADSAATQAAFARLRAAGVQVSIDDCGSGVSSLAALRPLPLAELKIDRGIVADLEASPEARSVATAVIRMAHRLQLRVVAEGVESEAQRDWLVVHGCDELQGWLLAKPMAPHLMAAWALGDLERDAGAAPPDPAVG